MGTMAPAFRQIEPENREEVTFRVKYRTGSTVYNNHIFVLTLQVNIRLVFYYDYR
jgi:hypothetical protein